MKTKQYKIDMIARKLCLEDGRDPEHRITSGGLPRYKTFRYQKRASDALEGITDRTIAESVLAIIDLETRYVPDYFTESNTTVATAPDSIIEKDRKTPLNDKLAKYGLAERRDKETALDEFTATAAGIPFSRGGFVPPPNDAPRQIECVVGDELFIPNGCIQPVQPWGSNKYIVCKRKESI